MNDSTTPMSDIDQEIQSLLEPLRERREALQEQLAEYQAQAALVQEALKKLDRLERAIEPVKPAKRKPGAAAERNGPRVSEEKRERVMEVIRNLGQPKFYARQVIDALEGEMHSSSVDNAIILLRDEGKLANMGKEVIDGRRRTVYSIMPTSAELPPEPETA